MSPERLASALVGTYNRHDLDGYAALHAPGAHVEFANHAGAIALDGWVSVLARLFTALPDLAVTPVTLATAAAHAVLEVRQRGSHTGALVLDDAGRAALGCRVDHVPATGRTVDVTGVVVLDLDPAHGAIAVERHHWPPAWVYQQLGLMTVTVAPIRDVSRTGPQR